MSKLIHVSSNVSQPTERTIKPPKKKKIEFMMDPEDRREEIEKINTQIARRLITLNLKTGVEFMLVTIIPDSIASIVPSPDESKKRRKQKKNTIVNRPMTLFTSQGTIMTEFDQHFQKKDYDLFVGKQKMLHEIGATDKKDSMYKLLDKNHKYYDETYIGKHTNTTTTSSIKKPQSKEKRKRIEQQADVDDNDDDDDDNSNFGGYYDNDSNNESSPGAFDSN
jgi:hypothetical protein